ncbi:hypothetical protein AB1Y20_011642 [Prymnesium parvum]|uniref:SAP domain-containing protein n=1 Tax=Prymnesium parvum TaxID=97485 RepID=A0AB34IJM4_PRYPA
MFPVTDETTVNIAYTHKTRKIINSYYMNKYATLASEVVGVLAPTKTEEQLHKCQDVKLFAGAPIIAIRTVKKMKVYNAEMFDVVEFPRPPTGWHNATLTQLKDIAQKMCLPSSGNKAALVERIENKESAFVIRSRRSGEEIHVPLERFHDMFRIAYCITVHQSQGQTIRERYTIFDWYLPFLKDEERARAKYVALSRGTRKDHVQIDTSDSVLYGDDVLKSFIEHVVLNDDCVDDKPDFVTFAMRHMLDKHHAWAVEKRAKHNQLFVPRGMCTLGVYTELIDDIMEIKRRMS